MVNVRILHNPSSGDSLYSKDTLIEICEKQNLSWSYFSLKEAGWDEYSEKDQILLLCGGDGSVQKVVENLLEKNLNFPIALIPAGTANNISKSLPQHSIEILKAFPEMIPGVDIGSIRDCSSVSFFIESYGLGLLPLLIKKMSDYDSDGMKSDEKIETSRRELLKLTREYPGFRCEINVNGNVIQDTFLLVEILNTPYIGPNLKLVEECSPIDRQLNLVTVKVEDRAKFESYLLSLLEGHQTAYQTTGIMTDHLRIRWAQGPVHTDDESMEHSGKQACEIQLQKEMFPIFVAKT